MRGLGALSFGLFGASALAMAAAVWLAVSGLALDAGLRQVAATTGAAAPMAGIGRDMARLEAALADGNPTLVSEQFAAVRAGLVDALSVETRLSRLEPAEIERLARLGREFDRVLHPEMPGLRGVVAGQADHFARMTGEIRLREAAAFAALDTALQQRGDRTLQVVLLAALAMGLLGTALFLRRDLRRGIDPAMASMQQQAGEEAVRLAQARMRSMLSAELRVPLNGLLGLVGVMREASPPPTMAPLVDQLDRIARHLGAMLQDMIADPQAVREGDAPEPAKAFRPADLAGAMQDIYGPVAAGRGTRFTVSTADDMPAEVVGDGVRMQRAITQLCGGVLAADGVEDVELQLSHADGETRAALSFAHADGEAAALRIVEGDENGEGGLGPLLADGLIEQMGGRLEVATLESGRVLVLAAAPSEPLPEARPRVRIVARTRSVGALGTAAAAAAGVDVVAISSAPLPDVVLLEAGGVEEAGTVAEIRSQWPNARLLALGMPDDPALFDAIIEPPLQPARVSEAVGEAWRDCQTGSQPAMQAAVALDHHGAGVANGAADRRTHAI